MPRLSTITSAGSLLLVAACAGGPRPSVQASQAAATDSSIRSSRAALGRAAQLWQADSVDRLLAADSAFHAQVMGLDVSRSAVVAFARPRGTNPSLLVTPKQAESCLDGGFETGTFTYRFSADPAVAARYGSYGISWTTANGTALVNRIVVDSSSDPRRIVRRVSCQTWRSVQLRARRAIVSATVATNQQGVPKGIYDDLTAAGWSKGWVDDECVSIGDKNNDYANAASAIDVGSVTHPDALSVFVDLRYRFGDRTEIQVGGTPMASSSCSTGYNPAGSTGISTFFEGRSYAAYVSRRFGDLRVGIGPSLQQVSMSARQANVRSVNPNRGTVSGEVARVEASKALPGIGGIVGYTVTLGGGFVADLNARMSKGGSFLLPALGSYTPKSASASSFAIGVGVGWAR